MKTVANLFKSGEFVGSFTTLRKAALYAENISSLSSSVPEAYRCVWQSHTQPNKVKRHTMVGTGYYIEEFELDPVLGLGAEPEDIEGELGSIKLGYTNVIEHDDGT